MTTPSPRALVNAQVAIESFDLSADGAWIVYAARVVARGAYRSHLWAVPWEGGRPRPLTDGAVRDGSPAISPDAQRVAFVRSAVGEEKSEPQVWVVPLAGGLPWQLTRLAHGAGTPRWSRMDAASPSWRRPELIASRSGRSGRGGHRPRVGSPAPTSATTRRACWGGARTCGSSRPAAARGLAS